MKRTLLILLILILALSGCTSQGESTLESESETLEVTSEVEPSGAEENILPPHSWAQAFYDELGDDFFHFRMRLIDVDFDGAPELFFVHWGSASNKAIFDGLAYKNGEVVEIEFDNEFGSIPSELSLLRNIHTDEKIWLAYGKFSSMAGAQQSFRYYFVDFLNLPQVRAEQVLVHDLDPIFNEEGNEILGFVHTRRLPNGESVETSLAEIGQLREEIFADFEEVGVQIFNRQEGKFVTDYRNGHNREQEWNALILMLSERE